MELVILPVPVAMERYEHELLQLGAAVQIMLCMHVYLHDMT